MLAGNSERRAEMEGGNKKDSNLYLNSKARQAVAICRDHHRLPCANKIFKCGVSGEKHAVFPNLVAFLAWH